MGWLLLKKSLAAQISINCLVGWLIVICISYAYIPPPSRFPTDLQNAVEELFILYTLATLFCLAFKHMLHMYKYCMRKKHTRLLFVKTFGPIQKWMMLGFYDALLATIFKAKVMDVGLLLIRFLGIMR